MDPAGQQQQAGPGEPEAFSQFPAPPGFYRLYEAGPAAGPPPPLPLKGQILALGETFDTVRHAKPFQQWLEAAKSLVQAALALVFASPTGQAAQPHDIINLVSCLMSIFLLVCYLINLFSVCRSVGAGCPICATPGCATNVHSAA